MPHEIEIVELNEIEGGVEVFARAWREDGTQIGFGNDGSVDIERFRIFNPPVLVSDDNGDIIQETIDNITGETRIFKYKEDPQEALIQSISHTISVMKNVHGQENITRGKRGNTTSTFYPDANPETTSVDGVVDTFGGTSSWDTAHDYASAPAGRANDSAADANTGVSGIFNGNVFIARGFYLFDTSSIPDTDIISSATFSVKPTENGSSGDNDGDNWVTIVQSSPASNTALVVGDFDQCGAIDNPTEGIDTGSRIGTSSLTANVYSNYALNATGLSWISKTGITKLGMREGHDVLDRAYAGANNTKNGASHYFADQTGTTNDPKLVVEHSAGATFTPRVSFIM